MPAAGCRHYQQYAVAKQDCDYREDGMYKSCERPRECKRQGVPFLEGLVSYELKEINLNQHRGEGAEK